MQYLLLIYDEESTWARMPDAERNAAYAEYAAYTTALQESGALVGANQLQPTGTATSVRIRDDEQVVTDGPFAETKEALGGYYLIDVVVSFFACVYQSAEMGTTSAVRVSWSSACTRYWSPRWR